MLTTNVKVLQNSLFIMRAIDGHLPRLARRDVAAPYL